METDRMMIRKPSLSHTEPKGRETASEKWRILNPAMKFRIMFGGGNAKLSACSVGMID